MLWTLLFIIFLALWIGTILAGANETHEYKQRMFSEMRRQDKLRAEEAKRHTNSEETWAKWIKTPRNWNDLDS